MWDTRRKIVKPFFCALAFALFVQSDSIGQSFAAFHTTIEDGLPSNTVYDLFQDSAGNVWVGTDNGLARYNGHDFQYYPGKGVKSLAISGLQKGPNGQLWMINFHGQVLYLENDTLHPLTEWDKLGKNGYPWIISRADTLYIINNNKGLFSYTTHDSTLTHISTFKGEQTYIKATVAQEVWMNDGRHTIRVVPPDPDSSTYLHLDVQPKQGIASIDRIGGGRLMFPPNQGSGYLWNDSTGWEKFRIDNLPDQVKVRDVASFGESGMAVLTNQGGWVLPRHDSVISVLAGKNISAAISLQEGGLLLGTLDQGLWLLPSMQSLAFPSQTGQQYYRLVYDKKRNWIIAGDRSGSLHFYDRQGNLAQPSTPKEPTGIQSLFIDTLADRLLLQVDRLKSIKMGSSGFEDFSPSTCKDILRIGEKYYAATSFGLARWSTDGQHLAVQSRMRMTRLLLINDHDLLINSQAGLLLYDTQSNEFITDQLNLEVVPESPTEFAKWGHHTIVGTADRGVYIFNGPKLWWHITTAEGLFSGRVVSLDVSDDFLAIGTNHGAHVVHLPTRKITTIDRSHGLIGSEVIDLKLVEGELWVANSYGLQCFRLPLPTKKQAPRIILKSVTLEGELIPLQHLEIPYLHQEVRLTFDVLHTLFAQGKTQIHYRIPTLNGDRWNQTTLAQPYATYLSLDPGKYIVEAFAINQEGRVSPTLAIPLTVKTPFWLRNWFIALCSLLSLGLVVFLVSFYLRRINQRRRQELVSKNKEQQLRIAQLTSIRAQMNPHFIFNTMSLIQSLVVRKQTREAGRTIQDFSKLMRNVLEISSEELVTLEAELAVLEKYLAIEKRRFGNELDYELYCDPELSQEFYQIPSLLTQPFVENALRHGLLHKEGQKKLSVKFMKSNDGLVIYIEDNGIGRKAAAELRKSRHRPSFALDAYKKRLWLLNENRKHPLQLEILDLTNERGQALGTHVILTVPAEL